MLLALLVRRDGDFNLHRGCLVAFLVVKVNGVFHRDEMDEILGTLAGTYHREFPKLPFETEHVADYYVDRVKRNMHIVLCFSPVGEKFRQRALSFPGLIAGCTIDWFHSWPREALVAVGQHVLADFPPCQLGEPQMAASCVQAVASMHNRVVEVCKLFMQQYRRSYHVTPKSYLFFLSGCKEVSLPSLG
ncbi:unnamed protein product [Protopolystoma xenopodis]|uniref:Dynein heavy chain AAA module D4 domain-containing protein n=1 Tax=Protopolystoma xenopodis TaxID=117903 RepID=A0A448XSI7_9PLAT|nr:unnamed protein product [Protopolystoma xenopodis]